MEITLDAIISIITLFLGGGGGAFFTWRYMRRKARAEAEEAEATAKSAEIDMAQKVQDTYQQILEDKQKEVDDNHRLIDELRQDRDHYKKDRDELRNELEKLARQFLEFKMDNETKMLQMRRDIARNGRMVECMRPFLCGIAAECLNRVPVTISPAGDVEKTTRPRSQKKPSEPVEGVEPDTGSVF